MIKIYHVEDEEWDTIVTSFDNYEIYYKRGYLKACKAHGDGEPILIYLSNNETKAINVVLKCDVCNYKSLQGKVEKNKYFDFITPYGYGGFIVEGSAFESLIPEYEKYCQENNIVSEFVRFNPLCQNQIGLENIYEIKEQGRTVAINTKSEETVWENAQSRNRSKIRKALREGIETYWTKEPEFIDKFIPLYNKTMDKRNANNCYYFDREYYEILNNQLKYETMFFYSKYKDNICSAAIFFFDNQHMHYHLEGSDVNFEYLCPTNVLIHEAALWASKNNFKLLHLGGGVGMQEDSLFQFKKTFNKKEESLPFFIGKKVWNKKIYDELLNLYKNENENYFPRYKL